MSAGRLPQAAGRVHGVTDRLLTAAELGEMLGLSAGTILDRFQAGDLPGYRLFGRKGGPVRFRLSEVEHALDGWRVNGPGARPASVTAVWEP